MANQRNQRMQATILLAYENLLSDKPFRKITVQDISDAALVHRSTFYKHFQDQYDLLEALFEQKRQQSKLTIDQIFTHPFETLNSFGNARFQETLRHQFNDDAFRDAFLNYLIHLCKDTVDDDQRLVRFLAVGRIKGLTLCITVGNAPYNIFTDTATLDNIFSNPLNTVNY